MRPNWDEYFLLIAQAVSARATCPRAKVGAVLVSSENTILATGYNGAPKGNKHCTDVGCKMMNGHCWRARHAESNMYKHTEFVPEHSKIYNTMAPCPACMELWKPHVREFYFLEDYHGTWTSEEGECRTRYSDWEVTPIDSEHFGRIWRINKRPSHD